MSTRTASMTLALALLMGALAGCAPSPEPAPEPTPTFATEAEAFAAAEETYRAYVDALNEVDLSDPETFEGVYSWTTGEANAGERKSLSEMHADGWQVEGETKVDSVALGEFKPSSTNVVTLEVCTDVSAIQVRNGDGNSMVAADRPTYQSSVVTLTPDRLARTGLLISSIHGSDAPCGP